MTHIIHQQNTLLKQTKQKILQNLNYINEVIDMPLSGDSSFNTDGAFTIREAFNCYKDKQGIPLFKSIESTQPGGTYCLLFNKKDAVEVGTALLGIDATLDSIGSWKESNLHYRYIMEDEVNVAGVHPKSQGSDVWKSHYKIMCGSVPTEIKTNALQRPPRNKMNALFTLSYSDVVSEDSAMELDLTLDEDSSTTTTVTSNQTPRPGGSQWLRQDCYRAWQQ
jgi:hypothetical protein